MKASSEGRVEVQISSKDWIAREFPTGEKALEWAEENSHLTFYEENGETSVFRKGKNIFVIFHLPEEE